MASDARTRRRRRCRGERGPAAASLVERREAPHPYVTGVRAPSQRRAADRVMVRQGCLASTPAPPGAPFPSLRGRRKKGKGDARRPKTKCLGGGALATRLGRSFAGQEQSVEAHFGRRRMGCLTSESVVSPLRSIARGDAAC